jgi:hypothetical protein
VPCSAPARGTKAISNPPFNDVIDNNPCGRRIISTANGVSFVAHSLCLPHLKAKLGDKDIQPPYVDAA